MGESCLRGHSDFGALRSAPSVICAQAPNRLVYRPSTRSTGRFIYGPWEPALNQSAQAAGRMRTSPTDEMLATGRLIKDVQSPQLVRVLAALSVPTFIAV